MRVVAIAAPWFIALALCGTARGTITLISGYTRAQAGAADLSDFNVGPSTSVAKHVLGVAHTSASLTSSSASASGWASTSSNANAQASAWISWSAGGIVKYVYATSGKGLVFNNQTGTGSGSWGDGASGSQLIFAGVADFLGPGATSGMAMVTWGWEGLPGEAGKPLRPGEGYRPVLPGEGAILIGEEEGDEDLDSHIGSPVTAYQIAAIPVVGSYGHTDSIYTKLLEPIHPVDKDHAHEFVTDNAYASMTIPTLPGNVGAYLLEFDGTEHTIAPGDTFDFTTFDPEGVRSFRLWPASSSEPLSALDVIGVRFFEEGPTYLFQGQVPEPSTLALAGCGGAALLVARQRRRRAGSRTA